MANDVLRLADSDRQGLTQLLAELGLELTLIEAGTPIPGSFWGDDEAGLRGVRLYAREDTPLHSILHEACHYICMDADRRARLDTDAGSGDSEENAVCYLQLLLADSLGGGGRERMFRDMDAWGYSFRLGSTRRWFEEDADDARIWLINRNLIDQQQNPARVLRR